MPLRLRVPAQKRRQPNPGYFRRWLYLGCALATLGLLTHCRWDNDEIYHPKRLGTYLWADSVLYFLPPDSGSSTLLQKARAIAADGHTLATLSWDGTTLSYYDPGTTTPTKTLSLPAPCLTLTPKPETSGFLSGGPNGLWDVSPNRQPKLLDTTPTQNLLSNPSFMLAQITSTTLAARTASTPHLILEKTSLPGPIHAWWIEGPNGAAGTFHYRDTLYTFSYQSAARLFTIDMSRPASLQEKATSPYLTQRWGTEYLGAFSLSPQGMLSPLNIPNVRCFAVDFFGGYLYYVRQDTLWERDLKTAQTHLRAAPFSAQRIKVIGTYAQGRAKITTR